MPISQGSIEQGVVASGGSSFDYTVPPSQVLEIERIHLMNKAATAATFRMAVVPAGQVLSDPDHYLFYDVEIPANDTWIHPSFTLGPEETLHIEASAGGFTVSVFGKLT